MKNMQRFFGLFAPADEAGAAAGGDEVVTGGFQGAVERALGQGSGQPVAAEPAEPAEPVEEEEPAEVEEVATEEAEETPEAVEEEEEPASDPPAEPEELVKARVDLTEKTAKITELEGKLADQKVQVVGADVPLGHLADETALQDFEKNTEDVVDWCMDNPDGGECPFLKNEDGTDRELDRDDVKKLRSLARDNQRKLIPARREWFKADSARMENAKAVIPYLFVSGTEEAKLAAAVLADTKVLHGIPGSKVAAYEMAVGREFLKRLGPHALALVRDIDKQQAAAKTAPKKVATRPPVAGTPRPPVKTEKKPPEVRMSSHEDRVAAVLANQ